MIFTDSSSSSSSSSFENMNLTKHNSNELEILHINTVFFSNLVHRHIIFPLTPLLPEKLMIIGSDNTL